MVRRRKSSLVLFLCLQAMAVAIICLGSLINFHQYKIWGKPLIPKFVGYKRDIEKYSKTLSLSKLTRDHQHLQYDFPGAADVLQHDHPHLFGGSGLTIHFDHKQGFVATTHDSSSGLRGPPIS
jgi:hypothetical protein